MYSFDPDKWLFREPECRIHPRFRPYLDRARAGDLNALAEFLEADFRESDHTGAFYECVGYLVMELGLRQRNAVRKLQSVVRRGRFRSPLAKKEIYSYWYEKLLGPCQEARAFIRKARASDGSKKRKAIWREYVMQPLPTVRFASLAGKKNEEQLQTKENLRHQSARRAAVEELLKWSDANTKETKKEYLAAMGASGGDLEKLAQGNSLLAHVNRFSAFGFVPRDVFFDLAQTQHSAGLRNYGFTPGFVARRYACKIVRVSESAVSHKPVGKN